MKSQPRKPRDAAVESMHHDSLCSFSNVTTYDRDETATSIVAGSAFPKPSATSTWRSRTGQPTFVLLERNHHGVRDCRSAGERAEADEAPDRAARRRGVDQALSGVAVPDVVVSAHWGSWGIQFSAAGLQLSACVVAHFHASSAAARVLASRNTWHRSGARRRSWPSFPVLEALVAVSPWVGAWWTRWHSRVRLGDDVGHCARRSALGATLAGLFVFCDAIVENVLREWDDVATKRTLPVEFLCLVRLPRLGKHAAAGPPALRGGVDAKRRHLFDRREQCAQPSTCGSPVAGDAASRSAEEPVGSKRKYDSPVSEKQFATRAVRGPKRSILL